MPIVLDGAGEALNCGREQRVANRAQRRALRAMYRTCAYPGCEVVFDRCDIHHVIEWLRHGSTDLDNYLSLYYYHRRHDFSHRSPASTCGSASTRPAGNAPTTSSTTRTRRRSPTGGSASRTATPARLAGTPRKRRDDFDR